MHPNYIVFDFDGTIMESAPGITRSVRHALVTLGFPEPDEETLLKFIGPPLHPAFREFGGLSYEQAEEAVRVYRERYGAIYLTDAGRSAAAAYGACCERLCEQLGSALGLEMDVCRSAAYAALEQLPDALPELEKA